MPVWLTWAIEAALALWKGFQKPAPTIADEAARAATAETQLHQEQDANDVMVQAATARAAADAHSLPGSGPASAVNLDPAAPVNSSPDAHFRD